MKACREVNARSVLLPMNTRQFESLKPGRPLRHIGLLRYQRHRRKRRGLTFGVGIDAYLVRFGIVDMHRHVKRHGQFIWLRITQTDGQAGLRIAVDQQHLFPFLSQSDAEIGCRGRFADAALLICDGDDVCVHL